MKSCRIYLRRYFNKGGIIIAIIKYEAIHVTPMKAIKYVMNGEKTEKCRLVTGINISENAEDAFEEFKDIYEYFSHERFFKKSLELINDDENDDEQDEETLKENIRLHHYIQSFVPGEITPDKANSLGVEWAKKVFGENRQILVCTHTDKAHIHNHILVAKYDNDGKVWYANKTSLKRCRKISDELCVNYGLSVIEKPKRKHSLKYNEYIILKDEKVKSWKFRLRYQIEDIIRKPTVNSISDLKAELELLGYDVSGRKYIYIKPKSSKGKKPMQSIKLGDGFAVEELEFRIKHKELYPLDNLAEGMQRNIGLYIRQSQYHLKSYHKKTNYEFSYRQARKSADLLCYISANKITNVTDFERILNKSDIAYKELLAQKDELSDKIKKCKSAETVNVSILFELENRLAKLDEKVKKAKAERDDIADKYLYLKNEVLGECKVMLDNFENGTETPVVPFAERVNQITEWTKFVRKKLDEQNREQQRIQQEYNNNYYEQI